MRNRGLALMLGVFAIFFFATAVLRTSSRAATAPAASNAAANAAGNAWTDDAARAARIREREESIARELEALRREDTRLSELIARKAARGPRSEGAAFASAEDAGAVLLAELEYKTMVRRKLRVAREELGLDPSQMETYEALMKRARLDNSLRMYDPKIDRFDQATLLPLLDNEQLARYQARGKRLAETDLPRDIQNQMDWFDIDAETAAKVLPILKEEGIFDSNVFRKAVDHPDQKEALKAEIEADAARCLARLRPVLPPASFLKAERNLAEAVKDAQRRLDELEALLK